MAGTSPTPHASRGRAVWPAELRRAAVYLAASGVCYWMSFAFGGWTIWIANFGLVYMDLLLAWVAVLLNIFAWPDLWDGLRHLVTAHPKEPDALVARRAFFVALALVGGAIIFLPIQYHVYASSETLLLVLYISAFPFLAWTFIPTLALHGILFGRVGNYLAPGARRLADVGAMVLFAVAGATTFVVLQTPSPTVFVRSWSVGSGILPAAACAGYLLIATAMTMRTLPEAKPIPTRGWAAAKTPRGGPERLT